MTDPEGEPVTNEPTIEILEASDGVPLTAVCTRCNRVWRRPDWDHHADTLTAWARSHERTP